MLYRFKYQLAVGWLLAKYTKVLEMLKISTKVAVYSVNDLTVIDFQKSFFDEI